MLTSLPEWLRNLVEGGLVVGLFIAVFDLRRVRDELVEMKYTIEEIRDLLRRNV